MVDRHIFVVPEHIHVHVHVDGGSSVDLNQKLDRILAFLGGIKTQETAMALDVQALVDEVAQVQSTQQSAVTFIQAVSAQLADLSSQLADQPAIQAQVDQMRSDLETSTQALATAITTPGGGGGGV